MKVLLIWSILDIQGAIPEDTCIYALEDKIAELAIECHGLYLGEDLQNKLQEEKVILLSEELDKMKPLPTEQPVDISGFAKVVLSGYYM